MATPLFTALAGSVVDETTGTLTITDKTAVYVDFSDPRDKLDVKRQGADSNPRQLLSGGKVQFNGKSHEVDILFAPDTYSFHSGGQLHGDVTIKYQELL